MEIVSDLIHGLIGRIFFAMTLVWIVAIQIFTPAQLIEIEDALLIAAGVGVTIAFFSSALQALRAREPTQGEILALGIWVAWLAIAGERIYSLIGRARGEGITFFNTDLHTALILLATLGAVCHLSAPEVIDGKFPVRAWVVLGGTAAGGVLIIALVFVMAGL